VQLKILFLDDEAWRVDIARRTFPAAALVHVQNVTSCLEQLREGPDGGWDVVSLDHDLGGERFVDSNRDDCGMYVVRWLAKFKRPIAMVIVHTLNQEAAPAMADKLRKAGYKVTTVPITLWAGAPKLTGGGPWRKTSSRLTG